MTTASFNAQRHYSRFIPKEEVGEASPWKFGAIDGSDEIAEKLRAETLLADESTEIKSLDVLEHEELLEQAREAAHRQGFAEGVAQGQADTARQWQQRMDDYVTGQGKQLAQRMAGVVDAMQARFAALDQHMAQDVLQLACDVARQVLRQEMETRPEALLPVVREALGQLIADGRPATVRVNPTDWATLEQPLRQELGHASVQWLADTAIAPGGCQVESNGTVIDASVARRWQQTVAKLGLDSAWDEPGVDTESRHGDSFTA